jgi:hypothetical protein
MRLFVLLALASLPAPLLALPCTVTGEFVGRTLLKESIGLPLILTAEGGKPRLQSDRLTLGLPDLPDGAFDLTGTTSDGRTYRVEYTAEGEVVITGTFDGLGNPPHVILATCTN